MSVMFGEDAWLDDVGDFYSDTDDQDLDEDLDEDEV